MTPHATPLPRIAWFVMVHHKPAQFEWLLNAIADPLDPIFVHVDAKSRLGLKRDRRGVMDAVRRIIALHPNVELMRSRFTNWGGWSLSQVLLDAIALALKRDANWQYFVNLSGQCYPLKPIADIKREIAAQDAMLHIEMLPIAELPTDDWHRDMPAMIETPLRVFRRGQSPAPKGFRVEHKGSQWVILPREFCQWLVDAPITRQIGAYLRRRLLSDELIMQTLAANSPYHDRIASDYGRAIVWPGPKTFTASDMPMLDKGGKWFGRKFDVTIDPLPLATLAQRHGFRAGPV